MVLVVVVLVVVLLLLALAAVLARVGRRGARLPVGALAGARLPAPPHSARQLALPAAGPLCNGQDGRRCAAQTASKRLSCLLWCGVFTADDESYYAYAVIRMAGLRSGAHTINKKRPPSTPPRTRTMDLDPALL